MPVLGNTSSGAITGAFPADSLIVSRIVLPEASADGATLAAYCGGSGPTGNVKMLVYSGSESYPGDLVAVSAPQLLDDEMLWLDSDFDGLSAGTYWVGFVSDVPVNVGYDIVSGQAAVSASVAGYYSSPPTTFPSGADEYPASASIYFDYEAAESGSSGTFAIPAISDTPTVLPLTLTGMQSGSFPAASVTDGPVVAPVSLAGIQRGAVSGLSLSASPVVAAGSLSGVQVGSFAGKNVSDQPAVSAPTITSVQQSAFTIAAASIQPLVTPPSLYAGVVPVDGTFSALVASIAPEVTTALLSSVQQGLFSVSSVSDQAVVLPATVTGQQVGAFTGKSVTDQPTVTPVSITGQQQSAFTQPSASVRPIVTPPSLYPGVVLVNGTFSALAIGLTPEVAAVLFSGSSTETFHVCGLTDRPTIPTSFGMSATIPATLADAATITANLEFLQC